MQKFVIANWKMNIGTRESVALSHSVLLFIRGKKVVPDIVLCPSFPALGEVRKVVVRSKIALGAQNMFFEERGSFTGEVSAKMLTELNCEYLIIGHSERRKCFHETDDVVHKKVLSAIKNHVTPIICVGEDREQREAGKAKEIVGDQVRSALSGIQSDTPIIFAYEPLWSISSNKDSEPAHPSDAVEMHAFIREVADRSDLFVLYGGSVNDKNAYSFLREQEIDGVLVGAASLKMSQFKGIIAAATEVIEGLLTK